MDHRFKLVALLPIKANSERVPGKNFRNFAGRPLFHWILDALISVEAIDRIVINTDASDLLVEHGLKINDRIILRDRKKELCGDMVSMNLILEDDIQNVDADCYLMTHATNPLLMPETIHNAIEAYEAGLKNGHDSLFSVNRMQTRFYRHDGSPVNHDPANLIRTQDLEPWYEENSNLYIFSKASFHSTRARIGDKPVLFETPHMESADIDDATGWHLAEIIALSRYISESTLHFQKQ